MPAGEVPANKTKTKKLIIFGFFLINIQTGPAGSSTLEGERRRKKTQTKSNRHSFSRGSLSFVSRSWIYLLSEAICFTLIPKFLSVRVWSKVFFVCLL